MFMWLKLTGSVDVTVRSNTAVLGTTVPFCEGTDADVFAKVDVACDSSCSEVSTFCHSKTLLNGFGAHQHGCRTSPTINRSAMHACGSKRSGVKKAHRVVGRELLLGSGLDDVNPGRDVELACKDTRDPRLAGPAMSNA